jgi:hypothetical protein
LKGKRIHSVNKPVPKTSSSKKPHQTSQKAFPVVHKNEPSTTSNFDAAGKFGERPDVALLPANSPVNVSGFLRTGVSFMTGTSQQPDAGVYYRNWRETGNEPEGMVMNQHERPANSFVEKIACTDYTSPCDEKSREDHAGWGDYERGYIRQRLFNRPSISTESSYGMISTNSTYLFDLLCSCCKKILTPCLEYPANYRGGFLC